MNDLLDPAESGQGVTGIALVAKQPVFDLQGAVWGYELLFRDPSLSPGLGNKSAQAATSTVMIDGFSLLRPMLRDKQRFLINFTAEFLEQELPQVLPPETCIIEILESVEPTKSVLQGLASLKQQGYLLALDDYIGQDSLHPFLSLVDVIKVDVLELGQNAQIAKIAHNLKAYKAMLLAEKVEDRETASFCRTQGFSLFQGFFYSKPEVVRGIKLNPSQLTKTRLLALMADQNANFQQISDILSTDVVLTYRLLNYINSVYFGLTVKVQDVGHAAVLLGTQKLRQWLFVSALAGLDASPMSQELVYISAYRAKFLETLAQSVTKNDKGLSAKLFLVGLFSMLESLMRVPADEIFAQLSLDPEVQDVLVGGKGPLAPWYGIMVAYEQGLWDEVNVLAKTMNISDKQLSEAYIVAGQWAGAACSPPPSG
ncbi:MAG: HDOD domain-containing protein [Desulfovibrionaceae bacterium]|nr:HDOD domain-containing protein [Desulfovibrionaceae bacterium]